jgi:hypothetical protein
MFLNLITAEFAEGAEFYVFYRRGSFSLREKDRMSGSTTLCGRLR